MSKNNALCETVQTEEGLALSMVSGVFTSTAMAAALKYNQAWLTEHRPPVLIADYSRSVIAVRPEVLMAGIKAATTGTDECGLLIPTALVVQGWQLEMLETYSSQMRLNGISRAAFTCPDRARAWAVMQAETRAAESAYLLLKRIFR